MPYVDRSRYHGICADLVEQEKEFWDTYVIPHEPPPDASIPEKTDMLVEADEEQLTLLEQLQEADQTVSEAKDEYDALRAQVEQEIGDNAGIFHDTIGKVTFKAPKPSEKVDYKAVAADFGALHPDLCEASMEKHTKATQGKRRFLKKWHE